MGLIDTILNAKYASDYETGRVLARRYPTKTLDQLETYFTGSAESKARKRAGAEEIIRKREVGGDDD